jgi:hypothetical protein
MCPSHCTGAFARRYPLNRLTLRLAVFTSPSIRSGIGSGNLFYETQKYGLSISGIKVSGFRITRIELTGTALNLDSAADIIGTYTGADAGGSTVGRAKTARLENPKGAVLEIQGVNLSRKFTLNLDGMTIKILGWQTSQQ